MCGRYTLYDNAKTIAKRYDARLHFPFTPNYNVAPGQSMPVVAVAGDGKRQIEQMRWGLIPSWAKDKAIGYKLINARDDSIFAKPVWRSVILRRRVLIPADGFYEWKGAIEPKGRKQPFYIHPKREGIFSFAGVWDQWKDSIGIEWKTYSIITTEPNKEMSAIHNRMPVILDPRDEDAWLDPRLNSKDKIEPFLHPYTDDGLEAHKVSSDVNTPQNNDRHLIYTLND